MPKVIRTFLTRLQLYPRMNPLAHVAINRAILEDHGIIGDRNLVLTGGILPDLAILQLIPWKPAHEDSLGFIAYLAEKDPEFLPFGFGWMLHGEAPCGLDSYSHGKGNFVDQLEMPVFNIVRKYKPKLYGEKLNLFIHSLIEFSCDTMVDKENAVILNNAFASLDTPRAAFHISNYFKGDGKKIHRILNFFQGFDFERLMEPKDVAKVWRSLEMYQSLGTGSLFQKYLKLTRTLTLIKTRPLTRMIVETRDLVRQPFIQHMKSSKDAISESMVKPFPNPMHAKQLGL